MKYRVGIASFCAVLAAASPSQAQERPDSTVIETIVESDLVALVQAEGHTIEEITSTEALPRVRGKTTEGLLFELAATACDDEGGFHCHGLEIEVSYPAGDRMTAERILAANLERAAIKTYWDRDDRIVGLTQYVILDGGVTWLNMRQNLRITLDVQDAVRAVLFD